MIDPGDLDSPIRVTRTGNTLRVRDRNKTIATFKEVDGEWELVPDWEEESLTEQQEAARAQRLAEQTEGRQKRFEEAWRKEIEDEKVEESVRYTTAQECFQKAADLLSECQDASCSGGLAAEHRYQADVWRELGLAIFAQEQANAKTIRDLTQSYGGAIASAARVPAPETGWYTP